MKTWTDVIAERGPITDHSFQPVWEHSDDNECTYREDGTDLTYCGFPDYSHVDAEGDESSDGVGGI